MEGVLRISGSKRAAEDSELQRQKSTFRDEHIQARASIGGGRGGGRVPPLFRVGGQHRNCPPHFSVQKNCEAYSLTQRSSLLKAAT